MAEWARGKSVELAAATVDHGLRPESATEATAVAQHMDHLDIAHSTLRWSSPDIAGNLQANARQARYRLLTDWAREREISHVCLGHTRDDQAETVLLRLARGSGVDGLAGMSEMRRDAFDMSWLRPVLFVRRSDLRRVVQDRGLSWIEDPSNENERFDRVRARHLLTGVSTLGLDVDTLADTATRMATAGQVLRQVARDAADCLAAVQAGDVVLNAERLAALGDETRWRILSESVRRVAGARYRPRLKSLQAAERALISGQRTTLHGCLLVPGKDWRITREFHAVAQLTGSAAGLWDGRWQITGPLDGVEIRALGPRGLQYIPDWRDAGLPRATLLASPAVWRGDALVAAPLLGYGTCWKANLIWDKAIFTDGLLSH